MTDEERRFSREMAAHLTSARARFAEFYTVADNADILLFDSLLMSRVLLAAALEASGRHLPPDRGRTFERDGVAVEQMFTGFREKVRASRAFLAAPAPMRALIERKVFEVRAEV